MTDAELFRRFILEARALSPPVARWLAAIVWGGLSPSRRRRIRDDLFREAARRLPPESVWHKAHQLAALARRPARPDASTPAGLVALGVSLYGPESGDRTLSQSQIFRVLVSRNPPVEMQVAGAVAWLSEEAMDR